MLQTIAILLISILIPTCLHSQIITEEYPQKAVEPDSLFTEFEYPALPSYIEKDDRRYLYKQKEDISVYMIQVVISFSVNEKGEVKRLHVNPLYGVGNSIPKQDVFWGDLEKNIRTAVQKWKFKTLYFPDGYQPQNHLINKYPGGRPYGGQQYHIMILNYNVDSYFHYRGLASFLYWMHAP
jgi:hypothetical protein